ncbi:MAG: hypothetical protein QXY87_07215 [Saccharolobus sp.]|uniref:Uncharacterized protein n=1 Tax=Saccharolobus shibatae (strain ATCC 51178 / DSM 5389 / JCM 8931 / NBRC 15437 / B12) TaxID=523848 RepID=A0A8F5BMQ6_SACSH|nr:hypothetical protein [Saccharolobus shibatae]MCH4815487.1 hypothetical protein [Saccharolobus shibatae]QXJ28131.1 Uncharacterized protein J5U23_00999 [Saccharolobus shibatae B12]
MSEKVTPIFSLGNFVMDKLGNVTQYTFFYYYDPENYYASLTREMVNKEIEVVKRNMQSFLDEEKIIINDRLTRAKVVSTDIFLLDITHPVIEFIITFRGKVRKGLNVYENFYEEEVTEYPYEVIWRFPGKILNVKMKGQISMLENFLKIKVNKGVKVGGRERIEFFLTS